MEKTKMASFLLLVAIGCAMMQTTSGLIHIVGGVTGWDTPMVKNFYCDWASHRTFGVGDELLFPFRPAMHTVVQVAAREDFDTCGRSHVINEWIMGPVRIPLTAPGDYFFYCGVGLHCNFGQKLHVVVGHGPGSDGIDWAARVRHHGRKLLSSGPENNMTRPVESA